MSVLKQRLLDLLKVQSRIFSQTYNPDRLRNGSSVLRQRLRGPSVAAYYPRRVSTFKDLEKAYKQMPGEEMETWDDYEQDRLDGIALRKARGKGAPKKQKTKADAKSKKAKKKSDASAKSGPLVWGKAGVGPVRQD